MAGHLSPVQRDVFLVGDVADHAECLVNYFEHVEVLFVELKGVLFHLGQVQQVHHQVAHHSRGVL